MPASAHGGDAPENECATIHLHVIPPFGLSGISKWAAWRDQANIFLSADATWSLARQNRNAIASATAGVATPNSSIA